VSEVTIRSINSVLDHYRCDPDVAAEMADHFSYETPGAQFSPAYKRGHWDGRLRLFKQGTLPAGLRDSAIGWLKDNGHTVREIDHRMSGSTLREDVTAFMDRIGVPAKFERRDHQVLPIAKAINTGRRLFLSPTSSGKSLVIYTLCRWFGHTRTLVLVPTLGLLKQMPADMISYGCPPKSIHTATSKDPWPSRNAHIVVTTWQTAIKQDEDWFAQFGMVIGDEAHLFQAKSLQEIMGRLVDCPLRFGFTGTLNGSKTHEMVLRGIFGPVEKVITTMELVKLGYVARPKVNVIRLCHPIHARAEMQARAAEIRRDARREKKKPGGLVYQAEIERLGQCEARNRFIVNLALKLTGATLVLFHREEHGLVLLEAFKRRTSRPVHFINGGVSALEREDIRQQIIAGGEDPILLASTGTTSTGTNIPTVRNLVFASPWKSRIVNLQSIGRGIRMSEGKEECQIFDLADDMTYREEANHTLDHMIERIKIYGEEGFEYTTHKVELSY
jgi:superfamily II DNA or RNA helicase